MQKIGIVSDAVWNDMDQDGWQDQIVVGEWMPITIYKNQKGKLVNQTQQYGLLNTTG